METIEPLIYIIDISLVCCARCRDCVLRTVARDHTLKANFQDRHPPLRLDDWRITIFVVPVFCCALLE